MNRREFVIGGLTATACPIAAPAQQNAQIRRIGFLSGGSQAVSMPIVSGFTDGMRDLGYVEGKDFVMEWRFADGQYDRFPSLAEELVRLNVSAIVLGTGAAVRPTQEATKTIPIVMGYSSDPVGSGFVASLAHPGGNITGLASSLEDTAAKQLELLKTLVPNLSGVGVLVNPGAPMTAVLRNVQDSAKSVGLTETSVECASQKLIEGALKEFHNAQRGALLVIPDALFMINRQQIADLALTEGIPTVFAQREYVLAGGLVSYGENLKDFFRRSAAFVDKILKGSKPADLPIEQPIKFFLVINLKTAKVLGLTVPTSLLALADEVIE